jgi:hypothetical protein
LWVLAFALSLCVLGALLLPEQRPQVRVARQPPKPVIATEPEAPAAPKPVLTKAPEKAPAARCAGQASVRCYRGDLWSFDGCGEPESKLEECGDMLCRTRGDTPFCELPDDEPCEYPEQGRCDGPIVTVCVAGRAREIDCRKLGMICSEGPEGAECRPKPRVSCEGLPRCDGDTLWWCDEGEGTRSDCAALGARCLTIDGAHAPSCVAVRPPLPELDTRCGPCGCPLSLAPSETRCDGRDDDGNGLVDEELDCGAVPVLALIAEDANGNSSYAREDIEAELARVNKLFANTMVPNPPRFVLDELVELPDPSLVELSEREFQALAMDARISELAAQRPQFVVPILFTDTLIAGGGTPKVGVSTLPNGTCGGLQESVGPELGVLAVAKGRSLTTVAHELGHFLGLCHTHDQQQGAPRSAVVGARGDAQSCALPCHDEGDGVCDTPYDPGPGECPYDLTCSAHCTSGDEPDAQNLMSYYTDCRSRFSDEQMRLMQHSLALRRGWHGCAHEKCACTLGGSDCPVGMSCRLRATDEPRCTLDGPRPPGAECESGFECGHNAMCLRTAARGGQYCVRACTASSDDCQCVDTHEGLSVCLDDLQGAGAGH